MSQLDINEQEVTILRVEEEFIAKVGLYPSLQAKQWNPEFGSVESTWTFF
jgi:hypothetical protein